MALEKFHYTLPDGSKLELPKFKHLPTGLVRRTRYLDAVSQILTYLEEVLTPNELESVDAMTVEEFGELAGAWQKDSKVTAGESSASSS